MPHEATALPSETRRAAPSRGERWAGLKLLGRAAARTTELPGERRQFDSADDSTDAFGKMSPSGPHH